MLITRDIPALTSPSPPTHQWGFQSPPLRQYDAFLRSASLGLSQFNPPYHLPLPLRLHALTGMRFCERKAFGCLRSNRYIMLSAIRLNHIAPASCRAFFMPAQLCLVDSSGVPAPRQWVSRLTARW